MNSWSIELSEKEFQAFSDLVHQKAGINLHSGKKQLVRARLATRIRSLKLGTFSQYYDYVINDHKGDELVLLLDSISTNLTQFFREPKHFDFMAEKFLPELAAARLKSDQRQIRVWSAGCSTGEEPYSIAITLLDNLSSFTGWDIKILATDLSTRVLGVARQAVYAEERVRDIPAATMRKYFQAGRGDWSGCFKVKDAVKKLVVFRRLNLMDPLPFSNPMDLIFCRNVMIYFDKKTQGELVDRLYQSLAKDGYLFIGHSESLTGVKHSFKYVQPTVYRK